jgi:subtilisin family serine protease
MKTKTNLLAAVSFLAALLLFPSARPVQAAAPAAADARSRYVESELLVKFEGGPRGAAAEQARDRMKHEVKRHFDFIGWQQIRLPRGMTVEEGLARYRNVPGVLAVEPNGLMRGIEPVASPVLFQPASESTQAAPNDPRFTNQWGLAKIGASNAWTVTTGSTNVVVAVIDSGINYNHEDLRDNMWRNPGEIPGNGLDDDGNGFIDDIHGIDTANDFWGNDSNPVDEGVWFSGASSLYYHGTSCAGVIGAVGNNGRGLAGVNWSVQLMALRVTGTNDVISVGDHIQALGYVVLMKGRGVNLRVVNTSFGTGFGFSQAQKDAMDAVAAQGVVQVASAGNQGFDLDVTPRSPSSYTTSNLLAVAASVQSDSLASFLPDWASNFGATNVDLAAPTLVPTCFGPNTNSYISDFGGTSAAAPHVAGAAALLFAAYPAATAEDVTGTLLESVDVLPAFTNKMVSNGRLNVGRAVLHPRFVSGPAVVVTQPQPQTLVLSNSATFRVSSGGIRPLHYQWLFNSAELADATNAALNLGSISFSHAGGYHVVVTNSLGSVTSQVATLTVVPLLITNHPQIQNIRFNANATNSVSVSSPVPVHYQWRFNLTNLVGPDSNTFVLAGVQLTNEGNYSVEVSNEFGSAVSSNAALVVLIDPAITIAPVSQSVVSGGSATFSVAFTGNPMPFGVEWRQGSITKASNTVWRLDDYFTLANAQPTNAATWRVIVRNLARNIPAGENRTFNLTVLADSDGDGLPDAWETANPTATNPAEDTDLDGLTNLQEYQAGTDPANNQSDLRVENIAHAAGSSAVSLRFTAVASKTYTIQRRATPESGEWSRLVDVLASPTNRLLEVIDLSGPPVNSQRIYRLATPRVP